MCVSDFQGSFPITELRSDLTNTLVCESSTAAVEFAVHQNEHNLTSAAVYLYNLSYTHTHTHTHIHTRRHIIAGVHL